ncbi:MAG: PD-(D/E)XK nuclease family protein [Elusimicrobia bacterium]|nr:PD-(D/E)XK nuclease family protein [Elusimicrobiota bacterium]
MLRVRYGPFDALEGSFVARLEELIARGVPTKAAVVAPSRRMADRLERLAAVERGLPLLGVEFHTFHSLALAIVDEGGFPDLTLIGDPVFHDRLVDGLLEERPALANYFGGPARPRALAGALRASLRDLIDAGVSPGALAEHFGDELLREPHERERLGALLSMAQAYEERLEKLGILSPSALVRLASARAQDCELLRSFGELLYYGFYDLTGLQLEFFEAVTSRHPSSLFFPFRRGHPAFRFAEPFFEEKLGGYELEEAGPQGAETALAPALDGLFGEGAAILPKGRLRVISASGARDEAWAVAKEILKLTDAGGVPYEDIGVVARTLEPYREAVAQVFAENAIPLSLGSDEPLLRAPLAKCALNLLTLRRRDFPAAIVEDLFCSPYFRPQPAAGSRRRWHWRQAIAALGIRAGWLQWRGKLESRLKEDLALSSGREGGYRIPKEDLAALWDFVSGLESELGQRGGSWSELARRARRVLERHLDLPESPDERESLASEAVSGALESLELFDFLGAPPSWDEFLEAFEAKLRRLTLESAQAGRGVRVMDAMDARGQSFRVLIIVGLKEKLFPRMVSEDPLLREPARAALRHPAGYWIARKSAGYEEERLLFYLTLASARERVICVYPRSDEAGKAEVPSLYLRELCRAAGRTLEGERVPRQPAEKLVGCPARLLSPKELSLRSAFAGVLPPSLLARVGGLNRFGKPGERDGLVGPAGEHLKKLDRDGLSPSALDEFAQCPFRYFADRVLGLGTRDDDASMGEFASWARGKIYHAVLEEFYSKPAGGNWGDRLDAAVESVFAAHDWKSMGVYPVLWLSSKKTMSACLREFLAWDLAEQKASGFRPLWLEKELRGAWPGRVPKDLAGLRAHGVIDRVDADEAGARFRIVDYKTRWRKKGKLAKLIAEGRLHQLPLYAELAAEALGGKAELAQAAIYCLEDSPDASGRERALSYEGKQWAADKKAYYELVAGQLEEIAKGRFLIKPNDDDFGYCRFCEFSTMCRKNHGPSRSRAMGVRL